MTAEMDLTKPTAPVVALENSSALQESALLIIEDAIDMLTVGMEVMKPIAVS